MKSLHIFFLLVIQVLAGPKAPYSIALSTEKIETIPIHNEIDTLLIFPEEVTTIIGKGLSSGSSPNGIVLYKQGEQNKKSIILRHLDNQSTILMTTIIKDEAFVFRIVAAPEPATVIYFLKGGAPHQKARKVSAEETILNKRPISEKRKSELIRLSKDSRLLKTQIPKFYTGFEERNVSLASTHDKVTTTIHRVTRFSKDDAIIFFGTIQNGGNSPLDLSKRSIHLQVGKMRLFRPNKFRVDRKIIAPRSSVNFEGLLLGNGKGTPQNLSLENKFLLLL